MYWYTVYQCLYHIWYYVWDLWCQSTYHTHHQPRRWPAVHKWTLAGHGGKRCKAGASGKTKDGPAKDSCCKRHKSQILHVAKCLNSCHHCIKYIYKYHERITWISNRQKSSQRLLQLPERLEGSVFLLAALQKSIIVHLYLFWSVSSKDLWKITGTRETSLGNLLCLSSSGRSIWHRYPKSDKTALPEGTEHIWTHGWWMLSAQGFLPKSDSILSNHHY